MQRETQSGGRGEHRELVSFAAAEQQPMKCQAEPGNPSRALASLLTRATRRKRRVLAKTLTLET